MAAAFGHLEMARLLVNTPADANWMDNRGCSGLQKYPVSRFAVSVMILQHKNRGMVKITFFSDWPPRVVTATLRHYYERELDPDELTNGR